MSSGQSLTQQALLLPVDERAELARRLIISLESEAPDADAEQLWNEEIKARMAEVDRGDVEPVDWRDAIQRTRDLLNRGGQK